MKADVVELFLDLKRIVERIPVDFAGGCVLSKSFLMAYLALEFDLKTYVEVGVYRGRSFFPMAYASRKLGGMAYGIDAYDCETAKEYDLDTELALRVNSFLESLDFARIHEEVIRLRDDLGLSGTAEIIKERSEVAARILEERDVEIDLLFIDGNHDTRHVMEDIELYAPLVRDGGFIVLDDTNWASVRPALNRLRKKLEVVFNNGQFAILSKGVPGNRMSSLEKQRLQILHSMVENFETVRALQGATVSVIVLSYNQEKYIAECLEGILAQKGDFRIELVIGDDCSTDSTLEVIKAYVEHFGNDNLEVKNLPTERNLGVTRNLQRCLEACTGQYVAFCEGDDYWVDSYKLQVQAAFLKSHPACALCFNDIHIYSQDSGEFFPFDLQEQIDADVLSTRELVQNYVIGNISCCMYDARYVRSLPAGLFDLFIGDWMFNIYYSQFGDIGHVKRKMSVYRRHGEGVWSGKSRLEKALLLHAYIEEYNRFLNYEFDREFSIEQKRVAADCPQEFYKQPWDIAIIDDVFPHPLSAFRVQEFEGYLKEFDRVKIYGSGQSVQVLGKATLEELVADFKRGHPEYAGRLEILEADTVINARLIYMVFLGNAYTNMERIEELGIPFVFTLYPGGMFGLKNERSDTFLRRVTSSPYFRKVIVTQQVTYDYLLEGRFCTPDQIELIFGVVTPIETIEQEYVGKKHFGIGKNTLDICFVAHKYVARGIDKGFDVFIDVARSLCGKYDDIRFHVVGGFDENEIDVTDIRDKITFYGKRDMGWFDEFYKDKDIIVSPNIPSMIFEGSFDGFPTGACVDAGVRRTAIFAADELHQNTHFADGQDIVIIPHDAAAITRVVEGYYREPERLKALGENGYRKVKQLYSYEAQMVPRVNILRKQVELEKIRTSAIEAEQAQVEKVRAPAILAEQARRDEARNAAILAEQAAIEEICNSALRAGIDGQAGGGAGQRVDARFATAVLWLSVGLWKSCPSWLQGRIRKGIRRVRTNEALFGAIKLVCPELLVRLYRKVRESKAKP